MPTEVPKIPTVTLAVENTTFATSSVLRFIPEGKTEADAVDFLVDLVDYDGTQEISELLFPSAKDGKLRPIRRDGNTDSESVTLKCYDLEKVKDMLGGLNGLADGTAEIWIRDPKSPKTQVRLYAAPFACSVQRDGQVKFGEKTYSSANLKYTNTSGDPIDFRFNQTLATA
jgi:hypothetical protein